jgi:hypothetical protein
MGNSILISFSTSEGRRFFIKHKEGSYIHPTSCSKLMKELLLPSFKFESLYEEDLNPVSGKLIYKNRLGTEISEAVSKHKCSCLCPFQLSNKLHSFSQGSCLLCSELCSCKLTQFKTFSSRKDSCICKICGLQQQHNCTSLCHKKHVFPKQRNTLNLKCILCGESCVHDFFSLSEDHVCDSCGMTSNHVLVYCLCGKKHFCKICLFKVENCKERKLNLQSTKPF